MTEFITNSAKITPYRRRPRHGGSFVTAYSHEPTADNPAAELGNLYCVAEVLVSGRQSEDLIDLVIETFGNHYYNQANQPFPLARFEQAVKETNRQLAAYVDKGNAAWIGKISAILAIVVGNEIHITHTGSAEGIIYRHHQPTNMTSDASPRSSTPTRTFGVVASGELETGDRILLATPALVHHVSATKLTATVSHHSPTTAIAELGQLIDKLAADRVAAIITEITTPELAASQVLDSKPTEVTVGTPANAAEAVKQIAVPAATDTIKQSGLFVQQNSRRALKQVHKTHQKLKPIIRKFGLSLAAMSRLALRSSKRRRILAILAVLIIALASWWMWQNHQSTQSRNQFKQYQEIFTTYQQLPIEQNNSQSTINELIKLQERYGTFKSSESTINKSLANSNLRDGEPRTYAAMAQVLQQRLDQLIGLINVEPTIIKNLKDANISAKHFELVSAKLYLFAGGDQPAIHIINPTSGSITTSTANVRGIGTITATTAAPNGDGVYILTDKPSVWFYQISTDKLTESVISYGSWPAGTAIAAYASNVYILSENTVYKFVRSSSGFSPRTTYAQLTGPANGATNLSIDGSVYVLNTEQLTELLSGTVKRTAALPITMTQLSKLRTLETATVMSAVNHQSDRIIIFDKTATKLAYSYQLKPNELTGIQDAIYSPTSKQFYVLTDSALAKVPLK